MRQEDNRKFTRYLYLTREKDNVQINFVWGETVGAWTNRNPVSLEIGMEIVHDAQERLKHNRNFMANPKAWKKTIFPAIEKYGLTAKEESKER